jgi:competence protein ComEC
MLYTAYHFHRLAPYGVIANLLAMPVVSVLVMPAGILGIVALPFGFDSMFWRLMGEGLDWMIAVALWVTSLPGSVGRMPAFGVGPLLLGSGGLIVLCLLKTPLRFTGAVVIAAASVWAFHSPLPDVLIAADGSSFAIRTAGGRLAMVKNGSDTFAFREWLAADADARSPKDKTLGEGIRCDENGCVGRLADGAVVAIPKTIEAFEEDCRRAALVASAREAPPDCAAQMVDRRAWQRNGALALRRVGKAWETVAARPDDYDRPWARARPRASDAETRLRPTQPAARDATPNSDELEPDD